MTWRFDDGTTESDNSHVSHVSQAVDFAALARFCLPLDSIGEVTKARR